MSLWRMDFPLLQIYVNYLSICLPKLKLRNTRWLWFFRWKPQSWQHYFLFLAIHWTMYYFEVYGCIIFRYVDVLYSGMWMYYIQVCGCIIFRYVDVLYSGIWMYYIQVCGCIIFSYMDVLYMLLRKIAFQEMTGN